MKIEKAGRKVKAPLWWDKLLSKVVPDIRLNFLNEKIRKSELGRKIVNKIPSQCPFERGYFLCWNDRKVLIYFVPALCKLNPLFNWIIDLKLEVFEEERFIRESKHLTLTNTESLHFLNHLLDSYIETNNSLTKIMKKTKNRIEDNA